LKEPLLDVGGIIFCFLGVKEGREVARHNWNTPILKLLHHSEEGKACEGMNTRKRLLCRVGIKI
jgi:hypothetical protein